MNTTPQDAPDTAPASVSPEPGVAWDHAAILSKLGGPTEAVQAIAAAGFPAPLPPTVWMWRTRSRVPTHWLPTILVVLARKGVFLHDLVLVGAGAPAARETGSA